MAKPTNANTTIFLRKPIGSLVNAAIMPIIPKTITLPTKGTEIRFFKKATSLTAS
jgi:hypothetical protein